MAFPLDRFYHRGHTWAHPENDGTVTIGLDDWARGCSAKRMRWSCRKPGLASRRTARRSACASRDADVRVLSPVDGEVVETGGADSGWYLKVKPGSNGEAAFRHLLRGAEIRPWMLREMERLQLALTAEGAAPALADGGVPVNDIAAATPPPIGTQSAARCS
jgi:hypothetical protein